MASKSRYRIRQKFTNCSRHQNLRNLPNHRFRLHDLHHQDAGTILAEQAASSDKNFHNLLGEKSDVYPSKHFDHLERSIFYPCG